LGIVILNYLAGDILNDLEQHTDVSGSTVEAELVDKNGYWLNSNNKENEWGFMFPDKKDVTLANIRPDIWQKINESDEGEFLLSDGLYTFSTIVPASGFDLKWKIYVFSPNNIVYQESNAVLKQLILIGLVFLLLVTSVVTVVILFIKRKDKENSLQKKYQYLFDNSHEAIMTLVPPDWKFSDGNPSTMNLFGLKDLSELRGVNPGDLSPEYQPDGRLSKDKVKEMIELALKNGYNVFDWVHKKMHGEEFLAVVTLNKINFGGQEYLQALVRDVTQEKKKEQLLEQTTKETKKALDEAERLNKLMVGRELEMIELKKQITDFKNK